MAERRMFSTRITDSDAFTELTPAAQALYFHLCMSADDDGFCDRVRRCLFCAQADNEDLGQLENARFVLTFEGTDVIVIKHWLIHNSIRKNRYHPTKYEDLLATLVVKENGAYTERGDMVVDQCTANVQPMVDQCTAEASLGKARQGKAMLGQTSSLSRSVPLAAANRSGRNKRPAEQHNYDFDMIEADLLRRQREGLTQ